MPKSKIPIDLLGASFSLTVEEDELYLQTLMGHYRTVIENISKTTGIEDPLKIAIIAGFQLCDDLEKMRSREATGKGVRESIEAEERIVSLIERIDSVLPPINSAPPDQPETPVLT